VAISSALRPAVGGRYILRPLPPRRVFLERSSPSRRTACTYASAILRSCLSRSGSFARSGLRFGRPESRGACGSRGSRASAGGIAGSGVEEDGWTDKEAGRRSGLPSLVQRCLSQFWKLSSTIADLPRRYPGLCAVGLISRDGVYDPTHISTRLGA